MDKNNQNQSPAQRLTNVREVALGLAKKVSQDYARRCPQCAQPECNTGCPLGIDIPSFIRLLREGDAQGALSVILQQNPFPSICGRVCTAPCESACIFNVDGNPISIRELERFAADHGAIKPFKKNIKPKNKKVAVIGSGPSGLMMAFILAGQGVEVTIFEAAPEPGGLWRYGIPEFRLPQRVLDETIVGVKQAGVKIVTDAVLGRTVMLSELLMRGFNAMVLALGAGLPVIEDIEGGSLAGVYQNIEFLMRAQRLNKGQALELAGELVGSKKTVVIGKSSGVFDSARLARRLGQEVVLCWTGSEEALAKARRQVVLAQDEGIDIKEGVALLKCVAGDNGRVASIVLKDLIENTPIELEASTVIIGSGQQPNHFIRQHLPQLKFNDNGTVWVDPTTAMTSVDKVFACGNIAIGSGPMVDAMAHAKMMAQYVIDYVEKI